MKITELMEESASWINNYLLLHKPNTRLGTDNTKPLYRCVTKAEDMIDYITDNAPEELVEFLLHRLAHHPECGLDSNGDYLNMAPIPLVLNGEYVVPDKSFIPVTEVLTDVNGELVPNGEYEDIS